jgi:hypothetical protein
MLVYYIDERAYVPYTQFEIQSFLLMNIYC